jgi:hypothetical protein
MKKKKEEEKSPLFQERLQQLCRKKLLDSIVAHVGRQGTGEKRKRAVLKEKAPLQFPYLREFTSL